MKTSLFLSRPFPGGKRVRGGLPHPSPHRYPAKQAFWMRQASARNCSHNYQRHWLLRHGVRLTATVNAATERLRRETFGFRRSMRLERVERQMPGGSQSVRHGSTDSDPRQSYDPQIPLAGQDDTPKLRSYITNLS